MLSGLFIDKTTSFIQLFITSKYEFRKDDLGPSICTCPAHTMDVRQDRIPSAAKWEHVRID